MLIISECNKIMSGLTTQIRSRNFWRLATNQVPLVKRYREKRVVSFSAEQMFDVVNAVDQYPLFVPWCKKVIVRKFNDRAAEYELSVGFPPLKEHYTSRVTTLHPTVIHAVCTEGRLFDVFDTTWRFGPSPGGLLQKNSCTILFTLEFQFKSAMYAWMSDMVFNQIVNKMVCAFLKRAEQLYGPNATPATISYGHKATGRLPLYQGSGNIKMDTTSTESC